MLLYGLIFVLFFLVVSKSVSVVEQLNQLFSDDKYHPEEVQSYFDPASISVLPLSGDDFVHRWPISGWAFD
jgi:hypothetical protein